MFLAATDRLHARNVVQRMKMKLSSWTREP